MTARQRGAGLSPASPPSPRSVALATELIPNCNYAGNSMDHRNRTIDTPSIIGQAQGIRPNPGLLRDIPLGPQ